MNLSAQRGEESVAAKLLEDGLRDLLILVAHDLTIGRTDWKVQSEMR
jgi:hypothetical protein